MVEMYHNLLPLASMCELSEADCITSYKQVDDPIVLSKLFTMHFPLMMRVAEGYWGISEADKASFCIEEIHKATLSFNSSKQTKFSTYFCTCLKNRFRTETQVLNYDKRSAMQSYLSFDNALGLPAIVFEAPDLFAEVELKIEINAQKQLTENEKSYCRYVIDNNNHVCDSDFAKKQGISAQAVHYIKEALRQKLNFMAV